MQDDDADWSLSEDVAVLDIPDGVEFMVATEDGDWATTAITYRYSEENGEQVVLGSYYGYSGGGTYDDGWFRIVGKTAEIAQGGETEEFPRNQAERELFEECTRTIWQLVRQHPDGEPVIRLTTAASMLAFDGECVSSMNFDGDEISAASQLWPLHLKFW